MARTFIIDRLLRFSLIAFLRWSRLSFFRTFITFHRIVTLPPFL